jgi:hypothetical protein
MKWKWIEGSLDFTQTGQPMSHGREQTTERWMTVTRTVCTSPPHIHTFRNQQIHRPQKIQL